jgi:hypothetical protein
MFGDFFAALPFLKPEPPPNPPVTVYEQVNSGITYVSYGQKLYRLQITEVPR